MSDAPPQPRTPPHAAAPSTTAPGWTPVPGPADRVHFLDEQRRRRRQTWRAFALCALSAAVLGVPLSMVLTPFAYLVLVVALRLLEPAAAVPDAVWAALADIAAWLPSLFGEGAPRIPFGSPVLALAAMLLPGMAVMLLVWLALLGLFRRAGTGGMLLHLGAREPRAGDLEERQLVNVVEEMAIAAAVAPPKVRLLDVDVPNAAAVGARGAESVVVVTRGLLDRLERDETQAVLGHLVASIGNGDLRIGLAVTTLFQAVELVFTVFDALFNLSRSAWRDLFRFLRWALSGRSDPAAAAAVARMFERGLGATREDGLTGLMDDLHRDKPRTLAGRAARSVPFLLVPLSPLLLLYGVFLFVRFEVFFMRMLVVGPLVMLALRTRRYLADAAAVQLTRDPDALARALEHLAAEGGVVPGGQWSAHLFVVGPEAARARLDAAHRARLQGHWQAAEGKGVLAHMRAGVAATRAAHTAQKESDAAAAGTWAAELSAVGSHPPLARRMKRVVAMGAAARREAGEAPRAAASGAMRVVAGIFGLVLVPLMALALYMLAILIAGIFLIATACAVVFMALAMSLVHALLV